MILIGEDGPEGESVEVCTGDLDTMSEVMHAGQQWTVDDKTLIDTCTPWDLYHVKLHRVPGRQDDALSEEWLDVEAEGSDGWEVLP